MMAPLSVIFLVLHIGASVVLSIPADDDQYPVPDPFSKGRMLYTFCKIVAYQSPTALAGSSVENSSALLKEEYFSIGSGLSFSLSRDRDDPDKPTVLLIGDGLRGRSYYVRNPNEDDVADWDCELDHLHHDRQVYPWTYRYKLHESSSKEFFIYGIGAIWLNAIKENLRSGMVNENSPLIDKNIWVLMTNDLILDLHFDQPDFSNGQNRSEAVQKQSLRTIKMTRFNHVVQDNKDASLVPRQTSLISIQEFKQGVNAGSDPRLGRLMALLYHCRTKTKEHRHFPSLKKALNLSPERLFSIDYLALRYDSYYNDNLDSPVEPEIPFHPQELISETFSAKREAYSICYVGTAKGAISDRTDCDLRLFTAKESTLPQSLYVTSHFHLIEYEDNRLSKCLPNKFRHEPESIMHHKLNFYRTGRTIYGHLAGLGALLMKAEDTPKKEFVVAGKMKKTITIESSPVKFPYKTVAIDEWRVLMGGRAVHFYFKSVASTVNHDITDLVRVEVKKISGSNPEDYELLMRFDIIKILTEISVKEMDFMLSAPEYCLGDNPATPDDGDDLPETGDNFDLGDAQSDNGLSEAEDFEFGAGEMPEYRELPSFFDFLSTHRAFAIESRIRVADGKTIYLREAFDTERQMAVYTIFFDQDEPKAADLVFAVNFNHEIIFRLAGRDNPCERVQDYDRWMRLFTAQVEYYRITDSEYENLSANASTGQEPLRVQEGNKLRHFGVSALWRAASGSDFTGFYGFEKADNSQTGKIKAIWYFREDDDDTMEFDLEFEFDRAAHDRAKESSKAAQITDLMTLKSISTRLLQGPSHSLFRPVSIEIVKIDWNIDAKEVSLPARCRAVPPMQAMADTQIDPKLPTFAESLGKNSVYSATYTLTNAKGETLPISEWFDLTAKRGVIKISGGVERRIYIDTKNKIMFDYQVSSGQCKRVGQLSSLIDFEEGFGSVAGTDRVNQHNLFGLASLWARLELLPTPLVHIYNLYDKQFNKREICSFRATGEWRSQEGASMLSTVSAEFETTFTETGQRETAPKFFEIRKAKERDRLKANGFKLADSITVSSFKSYRTSFETHDIELWELPEACMPLMSKNQVGAQFPSLTSLLKASQQLYMKSVVINIHPGATETRTNFVMEEWLHNGDVRLKTRGLYDDIDLLMYPQTSELFDVSIPNECATIAPVRFGSTLDVTRTILKLWSESKVSVSDPAMLFFAPVHLWLLAEKSPEGVQLVSKVEFGSAGDQLDEDYLEKLEQDLRTEVWQVSSADKSWDYLVYFERHSQDTQQWYTLERIELKSKRESWSDVNIDVVNYRYQHQIPDIMDQFLVPQGHKCRRDPAALNVFGHELDLNVSESFGIWYEAHLSVARYISDSEKALIPVASSSGIYAKTGSQLSKDLDIDLSTQYSRVRAADGSYHTDLEVLDRLAHAAYRVDMLTGKCTIRAYGYPYYDRWKLVFRAPKSDQKKSKEGVDRELKEVGKTIELLIDPFDFQRLFLDTKRYPFVPLNAYEVDDVVTIIGEKYLENIDLIDFGPEAFRGPTAIVRTFRYPKLEETKLHQQQQIKFITTNPKTGAPELIFEISMHMMPTFSLSALIQLNDFSDCLETDQDVRMFALEYEIDLMTFEESGVELIKEEFTKLLIKAANVSVPQFVREPQVEYSPELRAMTIYFDLSDPPTTVDYFIKADQARMAQDFEALSDLRVLNTIGECSKWCDEIDCLVMHYCADRSCRAITLGQLKTGKPSYGRTEIMKEVSGFSMDTSCTYYYMSELNRRIRLDSFAASMDQLINEPGPLSRLAPFSLNFDRVSSFPTRFFELDAEFRGPLNKVSLNQVLKRDMIDTFFTYKRDARVQVDQLVHSIDGASIQVTTKLAKTESECLELCDSIDCQLANYCKQKDDSCLLLTGVTDLKSLNKYFEPVAKEGCTINAKDVLVDYQRFRDALEPRRYERKYENYSPLECANLCEPASSLRADNTVFECLSFDICTSVDSGTSYCYLQSSHLLLDDFEQTKLAFKPQVADNGTESSLNMKCDHYSKSMLADFTRLKNKKVKGQFEVKTVGLEAERCALDCRQSTYCAAFEYCYDQNHQPAQSCYYMTADFFHDDDKEIGEDLLEKSSACSIYILDRQREELGLDLSLFGQVSEKAAQILDEHGGSIGIISSALLSVLGAILVASVIQFAYIRLVGKPINLLI